MTTLSTLRAQAHDPDRDDRAASDAALLLAGWTQHKLSSKPFVLGYEAPNGDLYMPGKQPNPAASIDDAAAMMPEGYAVFITNIPAGVSSVQFKGDGWDYTSDPETANTEPYARMLAALAALEVER